MRLLVTGANGFLGRAVVASAVERGHRVLAVVRPGAVLAAELRDPAVEVAHLDLRRASSSSSALSERFDVVVHAAAAPGGARAVQLANTVVATERFLDALQTAPARIVLVSSLSVYDYDQLPVGAVLDERVPLVADVTGRDPYTEAKMAQERLVRAWCRQRGVPCVVVRPGAIVGRGKSWDFGAALTLGPVAIVASPRAPFRVVDRGDCAAAIVLAAEADLDGETTLNVVADRLPTHAEFLRACRRAGAPVAVAVPVPWRAVDGVGRVLRSFGRRSSRGRLRLPELLDHRRQQARWKPLSYSNRRARDVLGWRPVASLDDMARAAVAPGGVGDGGG